MKILYATLSMLAIMFFNGCSDDKQAKDDPKDHVLRQQFDTMYDAKNATDAINQSTKTQDEQAAQIAGHE